MVEQKSQRFGRREFLTGAVAGSVAVTAMAGRTSAQSDRAGSDGSRRLRQRPPETVRRQQTAGTPETLEGAVTTAPEPVENGVLVGTDRGVYVAREGTIESFVRTRPVRHVLAASGGVAVVLLDDQHFATIKGIDLSDGSELWSHAPKRAVYSREFGQIERVVPGFDAETVGQGDGTRDVAFCVGSRLVVLDGSTGEISWTADRGSIVWQVAVAEGTVFGTTRDGRVVAHDAVTGDRIFDRQVASPYEHDRTGTVPRCAWDVEPVTVDGSTRLAVSTEDGTVALLKPADGSIVWQEQVVEFDRETLKNYYDRNPFKNESTIPGDSQFFNLRLTVAERDAGSILAVAVDVDRRARGRQYELGRQELYGVEAASGREAWSKKGLSSTQLATVRYNPQEDTLLLPSPPSERSQSIGRISVADGSEGERLSIPAVPGDRRGSNRLNDGYVARSGDSLVVTSTNGDLTKVSTDGDPSWSVPSLRNAAVMTGDFLGNGATDRLVYSQNNVGNQPQHRTLVCRDGRDGSVAWSRTMSVQAFYESGGLLSLRRLQRSDGGLDLVGVQRRPRTEDMDEQPVSTLVHLSGEDGSERARYDLVNQGEHANAGTGRRFRVLSLAVLGDVRGSGVPDILVGAGNRVFLVDLDTGDLLWERLYRDRGGDRGGDGATQWRPVEGRGIRYFDVGGNGDLSSLVAFAQDGGELGVVEPDQSGDELSFSTSSTAEFGDIDSQRMRVISDLNRDGYDELTFVQRGDEGQNRVVFSPGDGAVGATVDNAHRARIESVSLDNGSGDSAGMVTFKEGDGQSTVTLYEGFQRRWSHQLGHVGVLEDLGVSQPMPATPAGDVDGDGQMEVAVVKSSPRSGAKVEFRDPATDDLVDEVILEQMDDVNRPKLPGIHVQQIPDRTGDGVPELGVVAVTDGHSSSNASFYIVDPVERDILVSGRGVVSNFAVFEKAVGMLADDGSFTGIDPSAGVSLDEPTSASALDLSWTFDADRSYLTTVLVDGKLVDQTTDQSVTIRLPPGTFRVQVAATDPNGITVYDSRTVTTHESSMLGAGLYGLTVASLGVLFGIGLAPKIRRRLR